MDYVKLNEKYEAYLREHNLKITVAGRASRLEFAYWLEKNAAQHGVPPTCGSLRYLQETLTPRQLSALKDLFTPPTSG